MIYSQIPFKTFADALERVNRATAGMTKELGVLSCLGMAILIQEPDIQPEELSTLVKGASEYLYMSLGTRDTKAN